jgi:hypothetical protein
MLLADSGAFERWLMSQAPLGVVGTARDPVGDPLARYLTEVCHQVVAVGYNAARIGDQVARLPDWARRYQRLVDAKPPATSITAHEALTLLQSVRNAIRGRHRGV